MRFPWRCLLIVGAVVVGCLLVAACGGEQQEGAATPTPSPMPSGTVRPTATPRVTPASGGGLQRERPPSAVLRAGDARQTAALGAFCWEGFCASPFAVIVPAEPLAVATGDPLIFQLGFDPTKVYIAVWRPEQGAVDREPSDDTFAWRVQGPSERPVVEERPPVARTMEVRADLTVGTYIVDLFAKAAGGSASYGFHLEIVP